MSVIEGISIMSKSGCDDKKLLDYIYENLIEMSIRNRSTIGIFALTATWK